MFICFLMTYILCKCDWLQPNVKTISWYLDHEHAGNVDLMNIESLTFLDC